MESVSIDIGVKDYGSGTGNRSHDKGSLRSQGFG
jgi:hypothetical protein